MYEKNNLSPLEEKTKKLSQTLTAYISQFSSAMLLIFDMWGAEGGQHLQYKNDSNLKREHFISSCKYTHGVARQLSWPHNTLPCVLIVCSW